MSGQRSPKEKADYALDVMDGLADKWAVDVNLTAMIKNVVSPMRLNPKAPADVRAKFTGRMEAQIDAIVRQAFVEGIYCGVTGLSDDRAEMKKLRKAKPLPPDTKGDR